MKKTTMLTTMTKQPQQMNVISAMLLTLVLSIAPAWAYAGYDQPAYIDYENNTNSSLSIVSATTEDWQDTGVFIGNDTEIILNVTGSVAHCGTMPVTSPDLYSYRFSGIAAGQPLTIITSPPAETAMVGTTTIPLDANGYFKGVAPESGDLDIPHKLNENGFPEPRPEGFTVRIYNHSCFVTAATTTGNGSLQAIISQTRPESTVAGGPKDAPVRIIPNPPSQLPYKLWLKIQDAPGTYIDNSGEYYVNITTIDPTSRVSSIINWIVTPIEGRVNLITNRMYRTMVEDSGYKSAVKAALILYVVIYGLFFVLALVPITQMEMVIRVTKIAIISALLTTSTSWEFFNDTIFTLFREGRDFLLTKVVSTPSDANPNLFSFLDDPISRFFHSSTWVKMAALLAKPILGWVVFSMIVAAMWWFLLAAIEAIMSYITAIICLSLMIAVAPLFLVFMLFSQTKPMFDAWVGHLVNFALQPVILIASLALLNEILIVMFYQTLGFSTGKTCIWPVPEVISWITIDCFIEMPIPLSNFNPILILCYGIIFVIVTKMVRDYIEFAPTLVGVLTGENVIENISTGSQSGGLRALDQKFKGFLGQDDKSIQRRVAKDGKTDNQSGTVPRKGTSRDEGNLAGGDGL